jgi:hypothetical protein
MDKNQFIGLILIGAILFGYVLLNKRNAPEIPVNQQDTTKIIDSIEQNEIDTIIENLPDTTAIASDTNTFSPAISYHENPWVNCGENSNVQLPVFRRYRVDFLAYELKKEATVLKALSVVCLDALPPYPAFLKSTLLIAVSTGSIRKLGISYVDIFNLFPLEPTVFVKPVSKAVLAATSKPSAPSISFLANDGTMISGALYISEEIFSSSIISSGT